MTAIRDARDKSGLSQPKAVKIARAVDKRITQPILSNAERGIVNFTPEVLRALASAYNTPLEGVIRAPEYAYGSAAGRGTPAKKDAHKAKFRLSARVPDEYAKVYGRLQSNLKTCGYKTETEWLLDCLVKLDMAAGKVRRGGPRATA